MDEHTATRPRRQVVHLRIDPDLHRAIVAWAAHSHRTITGAVAYLIERGIEGEPTFPRPSRELDRRRAQQIADDFRPDVVSTVMADDVSVIDGTTRALAAGERFES